MDTNYEPTPLSLDDVQRLDEKNRADYLALRRLFESEGWRLVKDLVVQHQQAQMSQQLIAKNWDTVLLCRGAFAAYETVRTLEHAAEQTYLQISQQAASQESSEDELA